MRSALVLPFLVGAVVVILAVVALVVVLVLRSRREARQLREQEHRPLDPSVIECFPTGYQPPARPGAAGAGETAPGTAGPAPGTAGPTPGASTGRRSDDPTG
ncbi:hypothetical protein [Janibacter melonis]|uniref:hypothetical protein n=1 Tax=Janibacter melonis TaxID=262209 RepID=UPI00191B7489|nr:hypothetical protein [Janibacter melonis]